MDLVLETDSHVGLRGRVQLRTGRKAKRSRDKRGTAVSGKTTKVADFPGVLVAHR